MAGEEQSAASIFDIKWQAGRVVLALVVMFAATVIVAPAAQAQTFSVLHNFSGGGDGATPYAGVTIGPGGVLYGTASGGGNHDAGVVFKLTDQGSSWTLSPLYEFTGGSDRAEPYGAVAIGPNGALYGTTIYGGAGYGTAFELRPPLTACKAILCYWGETVLHTFTGTSDGEYPDHVNLAFDQAGNIYGTTYDGGMYGDGTTFELTASGGGYTESIIHNFGSSGTDGDSPYSGVVLDTAGNVYGTTDEGGTGGAGTLYQLMPSRGDGWRMSWLTSTGRMGVARTAT